MNYLISYCDKDNNILKEIYTSAAMSLSRIHANLIAYKYERKVVNISVFTYEDILVQALNENNIEKVLEVISIFNEDDKCTLNGLKELAINDGIEFEEEEYDKNKILQTLFVDEDDYIIKLYGELNAYGLIDLNRIEIFNCDQEMIMCEEINYEQKRAV